MSRNRHIETQTARPAVAAAVAATLLAALLISTGRSAHAATVTAATDIASPEDSASTLAQETGTPVVVDEDTTETTETTALPDGLFQLESTVRPVRVRRGDGWVPVDTTLTVAEDGTITPAASTMDMHFSPGGSGPLVTVATDTGASLSYQWPGALPAPTLSGSSAIYPDVLPGVDLEITAGPDNYSEVLIVKNAQAAANPALTDIEFTLTASGLTVTSDEDGISALGPDGQELLHGSIPQMWDSNETPAMGPSPTATDPGSGQLTPLAVSVQSGPQTSLSSSDGTAPAPTSTLTLVLAPPDDALTGPDVIYPVYIDPSMSVATTNWADVQSNGITGYNDPTGFTDLKVGLCDFAGCNGPWVSRAYFTFNTTHITRQTSAQTTTAKIYTAGVYATEIHEAISCTLYPVKLYKSGAISASTQWPGPLTTNLQQVNSSSGTGCSTTPKSNVVFNNSNVVSYLQSIATANTKSAAFALVAGSETNDYNWKRFSLNPKLVVTYNFPPSIPVNNSSDTGVNPTGRVACNGTTYVTTSHPSLRAKDHDNNSPALQVKITLKIYHHGSSTVLWTSPAGTVNSDAVYTNASSTLGDGTYDYTATAQNVTTDGTAVQSAAAPSGRVTFTVDTTPPANKPTVSSLGFPSNYWGKPSGTGVIRVYDGATTDAVGFAYGWDTASNIPALANTLCTYHQSSSTGGLAPDANGYADITPPALSTGPHTLYVRSFDAAHNVSATTSFKIYVSPNFGITDTRPEAESLSTSAPSFNPPAPAGTSADHCGGTGTVGSATTTQTNTAASGNQVQYLHSTCADPTYGPTYSITLPTVTLNADYAFGVGILKQADYGTYQIGLSHNGTVQYFQTSSGTRKKIDGYDTSTTGVREFIPLGAMHLQTGTTYNLVLQATGKNTASTGYSLAVDYLNITPINNVTTASFKAAMNNNGITSDGTAGNIEPGPTKRAYSAQQMADKGLAPGQTKTINGVTFTMPTANSNGYDNVVAMGQTIPVPWTPTAGITNIDLLVATTCYYNNDTNSGTILSASNTNTSITLNYQNTVPSTDPGYLSPTFNQLPAVPDWISGNTTGLTPVLSGGIDQNGDPTYDTITRAVTMTYTDNGTTKNTTEQPSLYHIKLPVYWSSGKVQGITLPMLGSDLTVNCKPSLHIFAIAHS